ncbi:MAG: DUF3052 domain-containing protein [Bacillota bacterium]|nr:DUF3052 domain-containing protein [Bacillota bacterium]
MNPVLKKIKYTEQNPVLILNAPEEYQDVLKDINSEIHTEIKGTYKFIQVFVKSMDEVKSVIEDVTSALDGDGYLWICYPKGTSKKYKSDCKRDVLVDAISPYNFLGVTLVAIDNDWSAMRFRDVKYIKSLNK